MNIMLLRDVYKLGQAGDVKKVADGYARNYLLPRRLAIPAREGAHGMVQRAQAAGVKMREQEAIDKAGLAEKLSKLRVTVPVQANEEGRLYGSVTHQMVADAIEVACGEKIDRRSVMSAALRQTGVHQVPIRLTAELTPSVTFVVHQEDEMPMVDDVEAPVPPYTGDGEEGATPDDLAVQQEDEMPMVDDVEPPVPPYPGDGEEGATPDDLAVQQTAI